MTQTSSPRSRRLRLASLAGGLLALAGCSTVSNSVGDVFARFDPYQRPGTWRPLGVNESNLELQVARSADLVQGRGAQDVDGVTAAAAVDRLRRDKMRPLPINGISGVGSNASATGTTAGGS